MPPPGAAPSARPARRRSGLRRQVQHPEEPGSSGAARSWSCRRPRRRRRSSPLQPDGVLLSNGPGDPAALPYIVETVRSTPGEGPDLRHLPRPPDPGAGGRGADGEAQIRPPRDQPAGEELPERPGRDHLPEPRVRGRPRIAPGGAGDDPGQPQRLHLRGDPLSGTQGLQRPAPPRGGAGTPRGGAPLRRVHRPDGRGEDR